MNVDLIKRRFTMIPAVAVTTVVASLAVRLFNLIIALLSGLIIPLMQHLLCRASGPNLAILPTVLGLNQCGDSCRGARDVHLQLLFLLRRDRVWHTKIIY